MTCRPPGIFHRPARLQTCSSVACVAALLCSVSSFQAQDPATETPAVPEPETSSPLMQLEPRRNSQDMDLKPIAGLPVLFAATETRLADFEKFLRATGYNWKHEPHFPQTGDHPVVNVTLEDAAAFCKWLTENERKIGAINDLQSYRLPTNREWDAAVGLAKGKEVAISVSQEIEDTRSFPWGLQWPPPARSGNFNAMEINGSDDGYAFTAPVGVFAPSATGLFDLAGNVWEWTWDGEDRLNAPATLRGGSWMYFRKECLTSSYRYVVPVDLRAASIGFRYVFEDRHQTAIFLANAGKAAREKEEERRSKLAAAPGVSADEVAKMRQEMEQRRAQGANSANELPALETLKPAASNTPFTNSLGMAFRPVPKLPVLVGAHEVRVQDYEAILAAAGKTWNKRPSFAIHPTHPVVNVSWQDAEGFCTALTERDRQNGLIPSTARYRLPSDAEWSAAVGLIDEPGADPAQKAGANKEDFPWGRGPWPPPTFSANLDTARMSGYVDNYSYTAPVGSFSPNENDIYDLAGNVAEWCADPWPGSTERVVRGSAWITSTEAECLSSVRQHFPETSALPHLGFRIVLDFGRP